MAKKTSNQERVFRALEFINLGYKDYIGARTLLLNKLPLQGATLGSSAVEKYIKALLAVRGENTQGHLKKAHISSLKNYIPDLTKKLNSEFLDFLRKCYSLRYTDGLPQNFNISVYARETLAELDYTIFNMEFQLNFQHAEGHEIYSMYRSAYKAGDTRLFSDNYLLLKQDKQMFLSNPDVAYGMRNRPNKGILEVEFKVFESIKDGKFCREAVVPVQTEQHENKPNE
ncbi:hypothetical protein [methanotrophic endosymbiont of Bathymodiolus puteoserpentis (Logatchev)]|jgi:hypothetical protein|uniref:hypothetical protein n=1 Tax=methanotrophic endosymbiont of Bathymodiolus puteoserpentis (Logatchev) TaxID=343235 RepID=UPI0013CA6407|nr:hypothetical protein [methanotrophic endosymbiont of Bathymodiolus puteoserpentis (Logatchev)]SHE21096.1 hypothetical protein BPUTEOMOX_2596 [methanotrophic endosymbiont of Bathymodiolus puteoserpentis (Logatchev)]